MPFKVTTEILKELRTIMKNTNHVCRSLQGYVIPSCDAHQSEYIAPCDQRRAFVSGFTGSDGTAIVTEKEAQLWTDGRYTLQAQQELDENWTLFSDSAEYFATSKLMSEHLTDGSYVGVDPFLLPYKTWVTLHKSLNNRGHSLVPVETNLVDLIWKDKPLRPANKVEHLSFNYTGQSWQEKVLAVQEEMKSENTTALVVTALDEVAWLFNLRGSDVPFNPVFFAYAVITLDCAYLLMNVECLTEEAKSSLKEIPENGTRLHIAPYSNIVSIINNVLAEKDGKIWIDSQSSYGIVSLISEKRRHMQLSPISNMKSVKNATEIAASKRAHLRDAVALCELFHWISKEIDGNITELTAVSKLEEFKSSQEAYVGPSFETISSSGPNAAVIHYKPREDTNRQLTRDEIFLLDSGSQYRDGGTTDVTRTLHFGNPSDFEKKCYTLVLKGVIALGNSVFPIHTRGNRIDAFARQALWEHGLDYRHGTGHGVGAYLNVHEGPMGIHFRVQPNDQGLVPGMILSNEPGYYENGYFGIRLENLALVKEAETPYRFKNEKFLTFEPLTLVPFQKKLLEPSLLTEKEIHWINSYHNTCREVVGKVLAEQNKHEPLKWLLSETEALG